MTKPLPQSASTPRLAKFGLCTMFSAKCRYKVTKHPEGSKPSFRVWAKKEFTSNQCVGKLKDLVS